MIECKCDNGKNKIMTKGSFVDIFSDLSHLLISLYKSVKTIDDNYGDLFLEALHGFTEHDTFLEFEKLHTAKSNEVIISKPDDAKENANV